MWNGADLDPGGIKAEAGPGKKFQVAEAFSSPVCSTDILKQKSCSRKDRVVAYAIAGNTVDPTETQNLLARFDPRSTANWPPGEVAIAPKGSRCQNVPPSVITQLVPSHMCAQMDANNNSCPVRVQHGGKNSTTCHASCGTCLPTTSHPESPKAQDRCTSCPFGLYLNYVSAAGSKSSSCHGQCITARPFQTTPAHCAACNECDPVTRSTLDLRTSPHTVGVSVYDLCYRQGSTVKVMNASAAEAVEGSNAPWTRLADPDGKWSAVVMVGQKAACTGLDCSKADLTDNVSNQFLDSLYFSLVTHSTIGYGDFSPTSNRGYMLIIMHALLMIIFGFL